MHEREIERGARQATDGPIADGARQDDIARHVALIVSDLAALARSADLELLAYLLDLTHAEAQASLGGEAPARRSTQRP